jgi:hypothetical protein
MFFISGPPSLSSSPHLPSRYILDLVTGSFEETDSDPKPRHFLGYTPGSPSPSILVLSSLLPSLTRDQSLVQ